MHHGALTETIGVWSLLVCGPEFVVFDIAALNSLAERSRCVLLSDSRECFPMARISIRSERSLLQPTEHLTGLCNLNKVEIHPRRWIPRNSKRLFLRERERKKELPNPEENVPI